MTSEKAEAALRDILEAVGDIQLLLGKHTHESLSADRVGIAAFERFLERISEAARRIPQDLTARHDDIQWQAVMNLGNRLRHEYHRVDFDLLWQIVEKGDLVKLRDAANKLLKDHF